MQFFTNIKLYRFSGLSFIFYTYLFSFKNTSFHADIMMRPFISLFILLLLSAGVSGEPASYNSKILLIPLDDRPPCLQFTEKMGLIGNVQVVSPPREILGRFTKPGEPDKIIQWIKQQDLRSFDAVILSVDMMAYGGLVASRVNATGTDKALKRMEFIREIRKKAPELPIYGQGVIMRLAPTADGKNEAYREKLARWADLSPYGENRSEIERLEKEIPSEALHEYKAARKRNLDINLQAVKLAENGSLDYLILSQDDAKPKGIHVADRERLNVVISQRNLGHKIVIQPGTDEISMILLARALNKKYSFSPTVRVIYSSETAANTIMPFEDRPLKKTVSYDIIAAGAKEVNRDEPSELLFYVFADRFQSGRAESFAAEIRKSINAGRHVLVADIDPKGNVQGGDTKFTMELAKHGILPELHGYASWNTAGNTIGTALPQGLIFALSREKLMKKKASSLKIRTAQTWFTFHRVLDDYYFHTLIRPKANEYFRQTDRSGFERSEEIARQVEKYSAKLLQQSFDELSGIFALKNAGKVCTASNMRFSLPWNRTFEGEIDFDMSCGF